MGHGSSRSAAAANILSPSELTLVENLFKSMSRSTGSIKRDDIFKHWSAHLDESLLQFVARFLCYDPVKKSSSINGENFGRLYVYAVRGSPEERATLFFQGVQDEEQKLVAPTETFVQYVRATIKSYLQLQKNAATANYSSWNIIGCTINMTRMTMRAQSVCKELAQHGEALSLEQLESWYAQAVDFKTIQSHVFQCLYLISQKKGDKNAVTRFNDITLLPRCKGLDNIPHFPSILNLSDILFLNISLPHELRNEWRFLFSSEIHGESFSTMLGRMEMQGATLIIVQDSDNHVFGAFASDSWTLGPNFFGNESCFLFKLEPDIVSFPSTNYNRHYQYLNLHMQTMPNGLLMGGQLNYPGFWLDCEYGTGKSSVSCTTFQNYSQLSAKEHFHIKHCEIWGVGEVPVAEEERGAGGRSILDANNESKVMLELAGKSLHSEGIREENEG